MRWLGLAPALAAVLWVAPPARANSVPGAVVQVSITGETTGSQVVTVPALPPDPQADCPAGYAQTGYHSSATVHWGVTYRGLLVTLTRATGALSSRKPPTSSGGVTSGDFSVVGTAYNPNDCPSGEPFSFSSNLFHAGRPTLTRDVGYDQFFLGSIGSNPASFTLSGYGTTPDSVPGILPFFTTTDALFLPIQSSKAVAAGFTDLGINWNKLLGRLGSLRHRRSFTVHGHGSFGGTWSGFSASALDSNGILSDDCAFAKSDFGSGNASCTDSTSSDYTITVRRTKLVTIARG